MMHQISLWLSIWYSIQHWAIFVFNFRICQFLSYCSAHCLAQCTPSKYHGMAYGVGSMRKWCNKSENESWQREDFEIVKIARQQILGRHSHTNASLTVLHLYHNVQCQMCTILTVYFSFGRNDDGWTYTTQPPLCDKIRGYVCIKCAIWFYPSVTHPEWAKLAQ